MTLHMESIKRILSDVASHMHPIVLCEHILNLILSKTLFLSRIVKVIVT